MPFCEKHKIVGIGWRDVDPKVLATPDRGALWAHVKTACTYHGGIPRKIGDAVGQLYRFAHECKVGDLVLYYDPPHKYVQICRVTSSLRHRDFDRETDVDIWHYREVQIAARPIPILDFYGGLKGALLGPRISFWDLGDERQVAARLFRGESPHVIAAPEFTEEARQRTAEERIVLLEAGDFRRFLLSGKLRLRLRECLMLPFNA